MKQERGRTNSIERFWSSHHSDSAEMLGVGKTVGMLRTSRGRVFEKEMSYSESMWRKDDVEFGSWDEFGFVVVAKMEVTDVFEQEISVSVVLEEQRALTRKSDKQWKLEPCNPHCYGGAPSIR